MSRLPTPGQDNGSWGDILNDYLSQAHSADGSLKAGVVGASQVQDGVLPKTKLDASTQASLGKADASVQSVVGRTGTVTGTQIAADSALTGAFAPSGKGLARPAMLFGKIKGGNITVKPSGHGWAGLWAEWDWDNWIKPQVDRARILGMNAVRIIGAPESVLVDPIAGTLLKVSQATYNGRWVQLADYCLRNGMYLYPAPVERWAYETYQTSQGGSAPWNFQNPTVTAVVVSCAQTLSTYSNVIGFDIFQEGAGASDGLVLADVLALFASIRAVAPNIPLTTSNSSGGFGSAPAFWNDTTSLSYQVQTAAGGADFIDLHVYLDTVNPADMDIFLNRISKPILIGEFGDSQDQTQSAQTARFQSISTLHNRTGVRGSFVWALADQSVTSSNQWGVWDNTGFSQPAFPSSTGSTPLSTTSGQRTFITNVLPSYNIADMPTLQYSQPNLLSAAQSRPVNSTTGWAVGANTYSFADGRGFGFSSSAAGNIQVSTSPATSIPVAASTYYRAEVQVLASTTSRTATLQVDWYNSSGVYVTSSPTVSGTTSTAAPLVLSTVAHSAATAAYAVLTIKVLATAAANEPSILLANPRPFLAAF
jgi:hypothetical protein